MLLSEHHLTQHHIFRAKNTEINEIYTVMAIRSFIISLIAIFIPIYLYNIGHSIQEIFLFYMIMFGAEAILEYPSARFLAKFGPKHNIALSLPVLVVHFWMLWTIPEYGWNIYFVALLGSFTMAFFWQGYHYDFSQAKHKKKAGKEISHLYVILAILGAVAPFTGGLIAKYFGFHGLFGLATFLLLFSVFPLFKTNDKKLSRKFDLKKIKYNKFLIRELVAYGASGIEASLGSNLWPLLIFLILGNYEKVGLVTSLGLILTVIVTAWVGKKADKGNKCSYIRVGSILSGVLYFTKAFAATIVQVLGLNLLTSVAHSIYLSPFVTEYYLHADEESRNEYIYLMEFFVDIARVFFFGIIYVLGFYFSGKQLVVSAIVLGGIFTFLIALMPQAKCEINKTIKVTSRLQKAK